MVEIGGKRQCGSLNCSGGFPHGRVVVSLDRKCLGAGWLVRERCFRGIFDKETRRKTMAVAGAAMELVTRIGLHG
jgi:hypothetical protein